MRLKTKVGLIPIPLLVASLVIVSSCTSNGTGSGQTTSSTTTPPSSPSSTTTQTPAVPSGFTTSGNQILSAAGSPFIARGLEVYDLSNSNWQNNLAQDAKVGNLTNQEFEAAHSFWNANIIRIQLAQDNLMAPNGSQYLTEIQGLVSMANNNGLAVILSDQTEETSNEPAPTQESVQFWQQIASSFSKNPSVIFDLFNEWRVPTTDLGSEQLTWQLWKNGGTDPGTSKTYVGMQQLANTVRGTGSTNLILAQGIGAGGVLDQVLSYQLAGSNIAYGVHPYFNQSEATNPTQIWDDRFGLASQKVPVMADEWGEYQSSKAECFPGAPQLVPQLLSYLASHKIGLVGWALFPGILIRGWSWTTPTQFDQTTYTCGNSIPFPNMSPEAQGAGGALQAYFTSGSTR